MNDGSVFMNFGLARLALLAPEYCLEFGNNLSIGYGTLGPYLDLSGYSLQGHPTDRFGKLSVRKALNPLQFSEGNFHLELS